MLSILAALSALLGWVYTTAWSLSFYPQVLLNQRRMSVRGLSIDFLYLNPLGFACYSTFNTVLLLSPSVRDEYRGRHSGHDPSVRWNDVAFAVHALLISSITAIQSLIYKRDATQRVSTYNRIFLLVTLLSILTATTLSATTSRLSFLDLLYFLSWIKLYISFAKYLPQAFLNYKRKSTVGWAIENILLDLTGGTLSLAQLVLDAWISDDWESVTGNPGKLGLSLLSIAFDLVFVLQHFVLYRDSPEEEGGASETSPLLDP